MFLCCSGAISWNSKKQPTVALSTTEAEYMAACKATKEAIWLRKLLTDLGYSQNSPTTIFQDNQSCIKLARNHTFHVRSKHIDIRHHFIRETIENKLIDLTYCSTENMIADILTKPSARQKFEKFRPSLGLVYMTI